ncbi:MAG TPA: ferritin [Deltaproteobacteria bacterium]|nr:MAG: ferritin [Deltaproteobacteria bacterium GWC2_65_14]HBO70202.1 ferritin [Deltaproteobacteria bacterium]
MAKETLREMLNDAIAREIQVSVQYMWQHVQAVGIAGEVARPIFKQIAITEMKHAEEIAERLNMLGGIPTTKPTTITIGETTKKMLSLNVAAEKDAIQLYRKIIALAAKEEDYVTKRMFEKILSDEEGHLNDFEGMLEGM